MTGDPVDPVPVDPMPSASPTQFPECPISAGDTHDAPELAAVYEASFFSDPTTTVCSTVPATGGVCMYGTAVPMGDDYSNWGASTALLVATANADGNVLAPFDVTELGITGLRITVSDVAGRPVRISFTQVDDPTISSSAENYQANGFVWGGSAPEVIVSDGEVTIALSEFTQPAWTNLIDPTTNMPAEGQRLDASQLHSLQVMIANDLNDPTEPYSVCVNELLWLDATENVVEVPAR